MSSGKNDCVRFRMDAFMAGLIIAMIAVRKTASSAIVSGGQDSIVSH